jgi:hypothetical protein
MAYTGRVHPRMLGRGAGVSAGTGDGKYRAKRAEAFDGSKFPSKAERDRYHVLLAMQARGEISGLKRQPRWRFEINGHELKWQNRAIFYTADFEYHEAATGQRVVEDVKGFMTRDVHIRLALMRAVHGIEIRIVKGAKG